MSEPNIANFLSHIFKTPASEIVYQNNVIFLTKKTSEGYLTLERANGKFYNFKVLDAPYTSGIKIISKCINLNSNKKQKISDMVYFEICRNVTKNYSSSDLSEDDKNKMEKNIQVDLILNILFPNEYIVYNERSINYINNFCCNINNEFINFCQIHIDEIEESNVAFFQNIPLWQDWLFKQSLTELIFKISGLEFKSSDISLANIEEIRDQIRTVSY